MRKDIKRLVSYYVDLYETRNPFELAKCLNVEVQIGVLGNTAGCYMFLKNHRCIFLNENLSENEIRRAGTLDFTPKRELLFYKKQNTSSHFQERD